MPQDSTATCPHGKLYGGVEQCLECRKSAGVAVVTGPPKVDTAEKRVNAATARLRELACWDEAKAQMREEPNVAVKWSAESTKWARIAMEIEAGIAEIEHDQWLIDQKRRLGN